jgi:hypothetical protein
MGTPLGANYLTPSRILIDYVRWPHMGKGRVIKPGQKIHASVAFIQSYEPRATFSDDVEGGSWLRILTQGRRDSIEWANEIKDLLELDLFDHTRLKILLDGIEKNMRSESIRHLGMWASTCMCTR